MPFSYSEPALDAPVIQKQKHSNWCWAASSIYVCNWYKSHPELTQPRLVARMLNQPVCATMTHLPGCNKPFDLGASLQQLGHLAEIPLNKPLTPAELIEYFSDYNRPLGCQILIPGSGGHAVVVAGIKKLQGEKLFLNVMDPYDGARLTMEYSTFRNNFRTANATWIRTYYTKPSGQF